MPILLDASPAEGDSRPARGKVQALDIGLVNNMPDAALRATERQFIGLLAGAAEEASVRLHLFTLPSVERGPAARAHIDAHYRGLDDLLGQKLDALIVTGTEPRAKSLAQEPYWTDFTRVVDWAEHNTLSTLWSCLAAHAAVLHLDGVARRPLAKKLSGVFASPAVSDHPLTAGAPTPRLVPHSRWNDLTETDLRAHGYDIVARSLGAGVDVFAKKWRSAFVFLQGHPEYGPDSLAREYRRDVGRYLLGERDHYPDLPAGAFDRRGETILSAFRAAALRRRGGAAITPFPDHAMPSPNAGAAWDEAARSLYRNWLKSIGAMKLSIAW